ncbi:MAG: UvrD-helicase domain-containing protein, partial [Polymorphobacter sp.]
TALGSDGGVTSGKRADNLAIWLGYALPAKLANFDLLAGVLFTQAGEPLKNPVPAGPLKRDPSLAALASDLAADIAACLELRRRLDTATLAARHLRVGARLATAYALHKLRAGVIDYDDMISRAARLLLAPGMGAWVRFKLDQRIDHLLIDEAQDTNVAQWDIIGALSDEFFDGEGACDSRRTLFVVGDFKQAIMSFQGSDPRVFQDRRDHFREKIESAELLWSEAPLSESFRSVPTVLEVVDAVLDELGYAELGLNDAVPPHAVARKSLPGAVTLWPPLESPPGSADNAPESATPWLPDNQVRMAQQVARQIATWLDPASPLYLPARGRNARPDDILVLVRARGEFMAPLVSSLHDFGVAVAGVDRLRLTKPLAVQDLLALVRFALQPGDDLTCATLLTSPFLGWTQAELLTLAAGRGRVSLWSRLGHATEPHARAAARWLGNVLALADYSAPYEFLETILSGPLGGRRRLLARLGDDARDAIGAILGQALAFEQANAPSLQGFLAWTEADDSDLKRDPDAARDAVRIMTVHGAKGLQAPVVILADATRDLPGDRAGHVMLGLDGGEPVPVFFGGKAGRIGDIARLADAADVAREQEHWRLMYVAMTRAEDMLFIGGALPRPRGESPATMPEKSWYATIERAMANNWDLPPEPDPVWGSCRTHRGGAGLPVADAERPPAESFGDMLPGWAVSAAAAEARPPRPLSPSALAEDDVAQPPPGAGAAAAARRGKLL